MRSDLWLRSGLFGVLPFVFAVPVSADPAPQTPPPGDTIIVTGQRSLRAGALDEREIVKTEIFDAKAIDRVHAVNINEALDKNPGIATQVECSICNVRNISLNNLPGRFTTLMIDGVPLFSSLSTAYGLDSVNVRGIARVEVARGAGASLIAPEAISGVVNIVSRKPIDTEAELSADIGSFGWRNVQGYAGWGDDRLGISASINHQRHKSVDRDGDRISEYTGYNRLIGGLALFGNDIGGIDFVVRGDLIRENRGGGATGSDYAAIKADGSGNPFDFSKGRHGSAAADGWFAPDGSGFKPYEDGRAGFSEIIFTRRQQLLGHGEGDVGPGRLRLAGGYAHNKQDSFYEKSTYLANSDQYFAELSYRVPVGPAKLTLGANYRAENLKSKGVNAAGQRNDGLDDYDYKVPGGFVQLYAPLFGDRLEANLSARLDHHNVFGTIFSPRANFLWHHSDVLSSRFAAGRGYRAPTSFFEQDHGILDTVRVVRLIDKPERSTNFSYALNYAEKAWLATLSYNYTRINNLAILDPSAKDPATGDAITLFTASKDPVTVHGVDANVSVRAAPGVQLSLAGEKYWYRFAEGALAFARPDFKLYATADWQLNPVHLFARATYTGAQDLARFYGHDRFNCDGSAKPTRAPGFVTLDAKAELHLADDRFALYAGVDNLTDYHQSDRDSFLWIDKEGAPDVTQIWGPNRGRFLYAGFKVSY